MEDNENPIADADGRPSARIRDKINSNDLSLLTGPESARKLKQGEESIKLIANPEILTKDGHDESHSEMSEPPPQKYQALRSLSKLCIHCHSILDNWTRLYQDMNSKVPHCDNIFALGKSAEYGCALCAQFAFCLYKFTMRELGKRPADRIPKGRGFIRLHRIGKGTGFGERCLRLILWFPFGIEDPGDCPEFMVSVLPAPASQVAHLSVKPDWSTITNTNDSIELCKKWLQRCCSDHDICRPAQTRFVPSRLVSVDLENPQLIITKDVTNIAKWATLSHCWGSSCLLLLQKKNIEEFRKRIPSVALSKTFRDAMFICQQLGVRYIWIDSLCIVQDDPEDWRRESAMMASVYGGSHINIAASGASDGSIGCFFDRHDSWRCQIEEIFENRTIVYDCVPFGMYRDSIAYMPLSRRGWALQERLLAPRTLLFTQTQVFWECHQNVACEIFPAKYPSQLTDRVMDFFDKKPPVQSMWESIIQLYSTCGLSYASDKLVAISGIARCIQLRNHDKYVAGMWRQDLERQLCWESMWHPETVDYPNPVPYLAPTWSWASLKFPTQLRRLYTCDPAETYIRVLDVETTPLGPDPLGPISDAKLYLACRILLCVSMDDMSTFATKVRGEWFSSVNFDEPPRSYGRRTTRVYVLPVMRIDDTYKAIDGLILERIDVTQGHYRRVASFQFLGDEKIQKFQDFSKNLDFHADLELILRYMKTMMG